MNETLQAHWSDCWREHGHHACAIRRIEQLEAQLAQFRLEVVDRLYEPCVWRLDGSDYITGCESNWFDVAFGDMKFCPDCGHPVQRETHDNAK